MRNRMISIICGSAFIFAANGIAFAAPPSAPAPVYNWTGWYVGGNAGASFGHAKTDFNVSNLLVTGAVIQFNIPGFAGSDITYPSGFIGGGQIGYNWQYSPLIVLGLEADFQGALARDTGNLNNPFSGTFPIIATTGTVATNYTTQIDWLGTVRGRVGYVWGNGEVMSYITAGLAYGDVKINGTNVFSATIGPAPFSVTQTIGHSQVNTGWVAGYGTEGRLGNTNWTWKVEGLYVDLGAVNATGITSGVFAGGIIPGVGPVSITGAQVTAHTHFTDSILRGGLNYKFH